jgi:HPt (histidine-containing phosphotransfer) domain-containing protein
VDTADVIDYHAAPYARAGSGLDGAHSQPRRQPHERRPTTVAVVTDLLPGVSSLGVRFLQRTLLEIPTLHSLLERAASERSVALTRVARIAHSIHGTGAAFGFQSVSDYAAAVERRARELANEPRVESSSVLDELHALVAQLEIGITAALMRLNSLPP